VNKLLKLASNMQQGISEEEKEESEEKEEKE